MTHTRAFDAVVLAGGHSTRMGRDKARLPHPVTGQSMVLHQLGLLRDLPAETLFVSARQGQELPPLPADVRRVDDDGASGPLGGVVRALEETACDHLIILAVDLPDLTSTELRTLSEHLTSSDRGAFACAPRGPQPLVSIVPRALAAELSRALTHADLSLRRLFAGRLSPRMSAVAFPHDGPFRNWNEPESSED